MDKIAVKIDDLTVAYNYKPVLWDIDLEIPEGVLMAIVGPNGAGKSTLIKAILGILKPIAGSEILIPHSNEMYIDNKTSQFNNRSYGKSYFMFR